MANILFTNVRILDGSGEHPFTGEVLVQGNRIKEVAHGARNVPANGHTVIDGAGATLMPGMCEAHLHLSWNDQPSLEAIQFMPPEEHTLFAARAAKTLLDAGFTMGVGAAAAKPRLDVVIRNAINAGEIPGPRYLANSQEITTTGGLGDMTLAHLPYKEMSFADIVDGPEEMRKSVRTFIRYGVDLIKLNLSGEEIAGMPAEVTSMADEECAIAVREAKLRGVRVCAHARSAKSIKMCVRHGIEIIYHASYADEEALDMLEAAKDRHYVAPGIAWLKRTSEDAADYGIPPESPMAIQYKREFETAVESLRKMHQRGIRVLPGGDYGFAWIPQGTNAKDLEYFVDFLGMSPMEVLTAATRHGGAIMGQPGELGQVKEGYLADLILVDGDPVSNIRVLQEPERILAVMKDGAFHKTPDMAAGAGQQRWAS